MKQLFCSAIWCWNRAETTASKPQMTDNVWSIYNQFINQISFKLSKYSSFYRGMWISVYSTEVAWVSRALQTGTAQTCVSLPMKRYWPFETHHDKSLFMDFDTFISMPEMQPSPGKWCLSDLCLVNDVFLLLKPKQTHTLYTHKSSPTSTKYLWVKQV